MALMLRGLFATALGALLAGCGRPAPANADVLNIYGWTDYHDEAMIREFTRQTGIRVRYDAFDSSDAKLTAGVF